MTRMLYDSSRWYIYYRLVRDDFAESRGSFLLHVFTIFKAGRERGREGENWVYR